MAKPRLLRAVLWGVTISLVILGSMLRWWPDSPMLPAMLRRHAPEVPRTTAAQRTPDHLRVLFIGNSFTAYNGGQDCLLEALSKSAGEPDTAICDRVAPEGQTLAGHWARHDALARIQEGNWDYVVLQEFSTTPLFDRKEMLDAARKFIPEIRKVGATPVLFMTWARRDMPTAAPTIDANCLEVGKELGIDVVPVGMAWQTAGKENKKVWLYYSDDKHPNGNGSYLTGCVFYSYFYGHSPVGLIHVIPAAKGARQWINVSDSDAAFMQDVAWRTIVAHPPVVEAQPRVAVDLGDGVKLDMILVPAGKFTMGSGEDEEGHDDVESPAHPVTIVRPFYMGEFEVTQDQFNAVMGRNQSHFRGDGKLPAECVSWGDCREFCAAVAKRTGRAIRLPTEAEWEYACRAGTTTPFNTGQSLSSEQANFDGTQPGGGAAAGPFRQKTMDVGSFKANAFGLYDMHGNVWEWCADRFHSDYVGCPTDGSAWMSGDSPNYVYRGGSWNNAADTCRSAVRYANNGDTLRTEAIGFRVAMDAR